MFLDHQNLNAFECIDKNNGISPSFSLRDGGRIVSVSLANFSGSSFFLILLDKYMPLHVHPDQDLDLCNISFKREVLNAYFSSFGKYVTLLSVYIILNIKFCWKFKSLSLIFWN